MKIKLLFTNFGLIAFLAPVALSCSLYKDNQNLSYNSWPYFSISATTDINKYISTDSDGFNNFAAQTWDEWDSSDQNYDITIYPFDNDLNQRISYNEGDVISDDNSPRLECLNNWGGFGSSTEWSLYGDLTLECTSTLTDKQTGNVLVDGDDYTLETDVVTLTSDESTLYQSQIYAMNALKIRFNLNKNNGYWWGRQITWNYHYQLTRTGGDHNVNRWLNLSYGFLLQQNVVQHEVVGPSETSNWYIHPDTGEALYQTPANNYRQDKYTKELVIPTRVTKLNDDFIQSGGLPNIETLSEEPAKVQYIIGARAFRNKPTLRYANIPSCTSIGDSAFSSSGGALTTINAPLCSTLAGSVFKNCGKLITANLPLLSSFPANGNIFSGTNLKQIRIGAPNGTPLTYNKLLDGTPIITSNVGTSDFNIMIPSANAETDPTKAGWATSYYNPIFGWSNTQTASGHFLSFFFRLSSGY